ncbi:MAG TPA: hypothetical protein VGD53_15170 [Actinoallomurus sp.]|jgi:hypothetical protein
MAHAAGWSVPFAIAVFFSAYVIAGVARTHHIETAVGSSAYSSSPHPPPRYLLWLLLPATLCWAACTLAEVALARTLAGDYPSLGPWAWAPGSALPRKVRDTIGGIDRKLGSVGGGCLAVAALAAAGPLVVIGWSMFTSSAIVLWVLIVFAATAVHLLSVRARLAAWRHRRSPDTDASR